MNRYEIQGEPKDLMDHAKVVAVLDEGPCGGKQKQGAVMTGNQDQSRGSDGPLPDFEMSILTSILMTDLLDRIADRMIESIF